VWQQNAETREVLSGLRREAGVDRVDLNGGCEWVVEARGCDPDALRSLPLLRRLFSDMILDLGLHPVVEPAWHQFPEPGGVTGMVVLRESHLACHTFPEYGSICLNLFCCRPRRDWNFADELSRRLGAGHVHVRCIDRPYNE
jgi:S-adenosylmethionine decarboxylase